MSLTLLSNIAWHIRRDATLHGRCSAKAPHPPEMRGPAQASVPTVAEWGKHGLRIMAETSL